MVHTHTHTNTHKHTHTHTHTHTHRCQYGSRKFGRMVVPGKTALSSNLVPEVTGDVTVCIQTQPHWLRVVGGGGLDLSLRESTGVEMFLCFRSTRKCLESPSGVTCGSVVIQFPNGLLIFIRWAQCVVGFTAAPCFRCKEIFRTSHLQLES